MYHGKELPKPSATKNQQNRRFELRTIEVAEQLRRFPWPKPANPLTSQQWICSLHSIIIEKRLGGSKRCSIFFNLKDPRYLKSSLLSSLGSFCKDTGRFPLCTCLNQLCLSLLLSLNRSRQPADTVTEPVVNRRDPVTG